MIGFNGGLIGGFRDTTTGIASVPGVWTANEQVVAQRSRRWIELPPDPFFSSVSLLLPGDGANGSTSIIDRSPSPKTVTAGGNAQISTTQSKFGGSSIAFDGNGDFLSTPAVTSLAPESGNFTVEMHVFFNSINTYDAFYVQGHALTSGDTENAFSFVRSGSELFWYRINSGLEISCSGPWSPITGVWYHIAVSRSDNSLRLFVNGSQIGSTFTNSTNYSFANSEPIRIGRYLANGNIQYHFNGFIDDLRVTKGVARYTANFTPPTAPHPPF